MSTLGTYSFLPWLRQGLANQITSADFDASVKVRASMVVGLDARGETLAGGSDSKPVSRPVELFGPGDIVGIDRRAIVRTEPRDWITNFEPNHLAHIEFYDEDFPWRYTPAAPDLAKGRLRPWITLLVLKEDEFKDGRDVRDKPLPYITVSNAAPFPPADELWAWAHVHVNRTLAAHDAEFVSHDVPAVIDKLQAVLRENPDLAYSRLVCPRRLAPNSAYHAFVIPTFEVGRRAGLGMDLGNTPATESAWAAARPEGFPYYHRWHFRTSSTGDFETLVRLLVPKPVDPRVGTREMDVQAPGSNVRGLDKPELGGILKLGGALRPPHDVPPKPPDTFEIWDDPFPRPLQDDLARLINLPDTYQADGEPDPVVAPPLYGRWHALTARVLDERDGTPVPSRDNWVHRLNLDPRFRVAAGFGTRVIQDQQEAFMDAAWEQIGKVLDAQRRIRFGQFGLLTSLAWYDRHLTPMLAVSRQNTLLLMAPLNKRVLTNGWTVHHTLSASLVQPALTSGALRRIARPRARLIRTLPFDTTRTPAQLLERVNAGEVSAAPPKVAPPGIVTADQIADAVAPASALFADWLRRYPQLPLVVLIAAIVFALLLLFVPVIGWVLAAAIAGGGVVLYRRLLQTQGAQRASDVLRDDSQTPQAVDRLPASPDFRISEPGDGFTATRGSTDSIEATRFKAALREQFEMTELGGEAGRDVAKTTLNIAALASDSLKALSPTRTIPKRVLAGLFIPPRIRDGMTPLPTETFVEPMAYPVIDLPMYEPLKNLSSELFLPNINLIEHNSVTLLETNQRFIESYMVGLNHEFARELLWREYPTDQRGSTFRQFWDVRGFFNADNLDDESLKEHLRDIPPLHRWSTVSKLGDHDNRETGTDSEEELVLVIRGELLKRYPTAVIYAHRACWQRKSVTPGDKDKSPCERSGAIDNTQERRLVPLTPDEELSPPRSKVLTPLYEAKVDPDIYFFGFDLTVKKAQGDTGENPADDPGWFFVIKERPGEPRFGLDDELAPTLQVWNDLSWPAVVPNPWQPYLAIASAPAAFPLSFPSGEDSEKEVQHNDDKKVVWSHDMSSAELAYILFQAPVLVAIHAREMLPK